MSTAPQARHLSMTEIEEAARATAQAIRKRYPKAEYLWGVPRGGIPAALAIVAHHEFHFRLSPTATTADVIVDDLVDTGNTRLRFNDRPFAALFSKGAIVQCAAFAIGKQMPDNAWLVFPWEATLEGSAEDIVTRMLQFIGEDPKRGGLQETPKRVIKAWGEWFSGYRVEPSDVLKSFKDGADKVDEMVVVRDIPVYSHCEHHLAPFFGVAHVGYIPNGCIVGLSKLVRLVDVFAKRLQVQERLTNQIADSLMADLKAKGAGVVIECRHLCMESRGVQKAGATTVTSAMRGAMMTKPEARAELMVLVRR